MVVLRSVTESNRAELEALRVSPSQELFVSSVAEALVEATEHPGAHAITWGVYAEDLPVGFVMIADEVDAPEYVPQYLWKLFIDERYQRHGYGTAALDQVVEYFRARPDVTMISTSAVEGEGGPIPFYERYGFVRTGEMFEGEVMLRLDLNSASSTRTRVSGSRS
jgi:diamine N-acetyltransferase